MRTPLTFLDPPTALGREIPITILRDNQPCNGFYVHARAPHPECLAGCICQPDSILIAGLASITFPFHGLVNRIQEVIADEDELLVVILAHELSHARFDRFGTVNVFASELVADTWSIHALRHWRANAPVWKPWSVLDDPTRGRLTSTEQAISARSGDGIEWHLI